MRPPIATIFVFVFSAAMLKASSTEIGVGIFGYVILAEVDRWFEKRARRKELDKLWDDLTSNWKPDPEFPDSEVNGNLSRMQLTGENKILYGRIVELLVRVNR